MAVLLAAGAALGGLKFALDLTLGGHQEEQRRQQQAESEQLVADLKAKVCT